MASYTSVIPEDQKDFRSFVCGTLVVQIMKCSQNFQSIDLFAEVYSEKGYHTDIKKTIFGIGLIDHNSPKSGETFSED